MKKVLETHHVFVDTQVFVAANFNYNSLPFQTLALLVRYGQAFVYSTDITINEVKSNIREEVEKAHSAFQSLQTTSKTRILKNISGPLNDALNAKFEVENVVGLLVRQFESFLRQVSAEIIPIEGVLISEVFEKYFSRKPPFGEGKKKDEFPDAFVLSALRKWCDGNKKIYVISGDPDMVSACDPPEALISITKLEEFLDLVSSSENEPNYSYVNELLDENWQAVEDKIIFEFQDTRFYLDEEDGEVRRAEVKTVNIVHKYIVRVEETRADIELLVEVSFWAEVTYADNTIEGISVSWAEETIERTMSVPVELRISYNLHDQYSFYIDYMSINIPDVVLSLWEDQGYPYK